MNKRNLLLIAAAAMALGVNASPLTPEEALERVRTSGPARLKARTPLSTRPVYTESTKEGTPAAYVFNTTGSGYLVLAADDVAFPVLGYSDNGAVDPADMSPEMVYWLGEYARQIEWASQHGARQASGVRRIEGMEAIAPQIQTKWNQDEPYNNQCPLSNGVRTYTGCVATSMAQVMNYHKYPDVGQGIMQYSPKTLPGRTLTLNFAQKEFDWDNMLPIYTSGEYNDAQADAVAYLMKACGYSVEMGYGTTSSGASGMVIGAAMVEYFKYDVGTHSEDRIVHSSSEWTKMIYDNLKNMGPVIINGQSPLQGGHSFIVDGYDGNGYFHFNWGWGGVSDGYYSLDALNPDAQGIGGFAGGFNFNQNGIFGIQPAKADSKPVPPRVIQYGACTATLSNNDITFNLKDYDPLGWGNAIDVSIDVVMGVECRPIDGTTGETTVTVGTIGPMSHLVMPVNSMYLSSAVQPKFTLPDLADGKYKLTLMTRDAKDESAEWYEVLPPWGYSNYVNLTVENGLYKVSDATVDKIRIDNVEALSPFYAGKSILLKATMSNDSDIELSQGLSPVLFDEAGKQVFIGQSIIVSLDAKESKEMEWVTQFYTPTGGNAVLSAPTEYTMRFYNPENRQYYDNAEMKVTLNPAPATTTLMLTGFSIEDATREQMTVLGQNFPTLWIPKDLHDFNVILKAKVTKGYYDGQITFNLLRQNPEVPSARLPFADDIYNVRPFMGEGEEREFVCNVANKDFVNGTVYFVEAVYTNGNRLTSMGRIGFIQLGEGVEIISAEDLENAEYYTPQGLRIDKPAPGQLVIIKAGGKSYKAIWK